MRSPAHVSLHAKGSLKGEVWRHSGVRGTLTAQSQSSVTIDHHTADSIIQPRIRTEQIARICDLPRVGHLLLCGCVCCHWPRGICGCDGGDGLPFLHNLRNRGSFISQSRLSQIVMLEEYILYRFQEEERHVAMLYIRGGSVMHCLQSSELEERCESGHESLSVSLWKSAY